RHLPFHRGAARILERALATGAPVAVLPVGLHYERAWSFRSRVEVVVGAPIETSLPGGPDDEARVAALHERIERVLETVGANFRDEAEQARAELLAGLVARRSELGYFEALKRFERGTPPELVRASDELAGCLALHQGVPLLPRRGLALELALLVAAGPLV